jgi:branched-chain amino acid transport system substrate-binding protein
MRIRLPIRVVCALTAACACVCVTPSTSAATGRAQTPFRVLAVVPLSGPLAFVGDLEGRSLAAAAGTINKSGGIRGHKVELKIVDDSGDGNVAISLLQQAMSGTTYNLIIPGATTGEAVPLAAALKSNPTIQIGITAADALNDPATYPAHFGTVEGFLPNATGLVARMKKDGVSRFAIVCGDTATGHSGAVALQSAAKDAGLSVTSTVFIPSGSADAAPQLQQVNGTNPQAIAMAGNTPATASVIAARVKLGLTIRLYGDATMGAAQFGTIASSSDLKGVIVQTFPYLVKGNAASKTKAFLAFLKGLHKYDPHPSSSLFTAVASWDQLMLARAAAIKSKSIDGATLTKVMSSITTAKQVPGWFGATKIFTATNHFPSVQNSDFIYVKPGPLVDGLMLAGKAGS